MTDTTQKENAEHAQMEKFTKDVAELIGRSQMNTTMAAFALMWAAANLLADMNSKARKGAPHKLKELIEGVTMERKQQARKNKQTEDWEKSHADRQAN